MISRAATVSGWHKDPAASYVFTLEDLKFLEDNLDETDDFLSLCRPQSQAPASPTAKGYWAKAVKYHGEGRRSVGATPVDDDQLLADAYAAVIELKQWSGRMRAANGGAQEYIQEKQDEVRTSLEGMSWPVGQPSASPTRLSLRKWLRPTRSEVRSRSPSPLSRLRSRLLPNSWQSDSTVVVKTPDALAEDVISSSDVPNIVVS